MICLINLKSETQQQSNENLFIIRMFLKVWLQIYGKTTKVTKLQSDIFISLPFRATDEVARL